MDKQMSVMAVTLILWIAIFVYLAILDRKVAKLERSDSEADDL